MTAMADGGARLAGELAMVEAEKREEREKGAGAHLGGTRWPVG